MKRPFLLSLLISLAVTSVNAQEQLKGGHSHSDGHHEHDKTVMISDRQPVPTIDLVVHEDSLKGWNLEIKLNNFELKPEMANKENQPNEGHAHLYVNDKKVTRIYGNWYYLGSLPKGRNEIKVQLNTNNHQLLMYRGKIIEDGEVIEVN